MEHKKENVTLCDAYSREVLEEEYYNLYIDGDYEFDREEYWCMFFSDETPSLDDYDEGSEEYEELEEQMNDLIEALEIITKSSG